MLKKYSILLVFLVPAALIVLIKVCPAKNQPVSDEPVISEAEARRIEAKERRAEREDDSFADALAAFGDELTDSPAAESSTAETPRQADPLSDF